jgi:Peptidase M15
LHDVVPPSQLLRSASSWADCQAQPFALPPPPQWADAAAVLRLIAELKTQAVLGAFEVHSSYRNPMLNACAGGATRSAHLLAYAVDLTPASPPELAQTLEALCTFWRSHGRDWKMGLGRYPSGRIHLDVHGWRSWGADGRSQSSPCASAR